MGRKIAASLVGYALWTAIWLGGGQVVQSMFKDQIGADQTITATAPLMWILVLSVVCSLVAGSVAGLISAGKGNGGMVALCVMLVATGVGVQMSIWDKLPVWYHISFLLLLAPMTLAGGSLMGSKRVAHA